ncbi:MAG: hypothetical protein R2726_04705 [Acidimicrobiales bacterium]
MEAGSKALVEVAVPQTHPLGAEAEVDFGAVSFYLDGVLCEGHMFVMRLSASAKGFHQVYPNEAQQAFLDGHVRAFAHFSGVPGRVRYDNLKPAVERVLRGRDRAESERFSGARIRHYRFRLDCSSVSPAPTAPAQKVAWKERWAGSVAVTWSRCPTSPRSPSSTT